MKGNKKMPVRIVIVLVLAAAMLIYGIGIRLRSNFNFGILLTYLISAGLFIYGMFYQPIDRFCERGIGFFFKVCFWCGVAFFAAMLVFVAVSGYSHQPQEKEKAVIVLGAGLKKDRPSGVLQRRLNAALEFYQQNSDIVLVVTGGKGRDETIPEAQAMAKYLEERGVPAEKIIVEDQSTSTEENLLFAKKLLAERKIDAGQPVAIVTNAFHCYRGRQYARKAGFSQVSSIPADISVESIPVCYMREVFAILYYWVFKSSINSWISEFVGVF